MIYEWLFYKLGRIGCFLGVHNTSCRGRRDHVRPDGTVIG